MYLKYYLIVFLIFINVESAHNSQSKKIVDQNYKAAEKYFDDGCTNIGRFFHKKGFNSESNSYNIYLKEGIEQLVEAAKCYALANDIKKVQECLGQIRSHLDCLDKNDMEVINQELGNLTVLIKNKISVKI